MERRSGAKRLKTDSASVKSVVKTEDCSEESKTSPDEDLLVKLSHQSVLDCPICFSPLTIPVYQCCNGHIICSPCHGKLKSKPIRKCPTCSIKLGRMRNLAIESVLETVKVVCSYKSRGCSQEFSYPTKASHEETCSYAPANIARLSYRCPFSPCNFSGSTRNLHLHLNNQHSTSVVPLTSPHSSSFNYSLSAQISARKADEFVVLLEKTADGGLFALDLRRMRISRIQDPDLSNGHRFTYTLYAENKCGRFQFNPTTHPWPDAKSDKETTAGTDKRTQDLLRITDCFYDHDDRIELRIDISCHTW